MRSQRFFKDVTDVAVGGSLLSDLALMEHQTEYSLKEWHLCFLPLQGGDGVSWMKPLNIKET